MKVGFCMLLWTTNVTAKHTKLLKDIKATGYDGVEIPIFSGTPDDFKRLGDMLDRIGLARTAVSAMGDPAMNLIGDAASRKAGIEYMKWAIDCAAALGADKLCGPLHSTLGLFTGSRPDLQPRKALRRIAARHRRPCGKQGRYGRAGGAEPLRMLPGQHDGRPFRASRRDRPSQYQGDVRHLPLPTSRRSRPVGAYAKT